MQRKGPRKSLRTLQRERQENRPLRDVAYMYGSSVKDQDLLIHQWGGGMILPNSGFVGEPKPGAMRIVYPYPVLGNDKAEALARCGFTQNDMRNNYIVVYPKQRLWRRPVGVLNDVEAQVHVKAHSAKPYFYQRPLQEQYLLTHPLQSVLVENKKEATGAGTATNAEPRETFFSIIDENAKGSSKNFRDALETDNRAAAKSSGKESGAAAGSAVEGILQSQSHSVSDTPIPSLSQHLEEGTLRSADDADGLAPRISPKRSLRLDGKRIVSWAPLLESDEKPKQSLTVEDNANRRKGSEDSESAGSIDIKPSRRILSREEPLPASFVKLQSNDSQESLTHISHSENVNISNAPGGRNAPPRSDGRRATLDIPGLLIQFGIPMKEVDDAKVLKQQRKFPGNHPLPGNAEPGIVFSRGLRRRTRGWNKVTRKWEESG